MDTKHNVCLAMHCVLYTVTQVCSIRMEFWHPSLLLSDSLFRVNSLNLGKASGKSDPEWHYKERKKCDVVVRRWDVVPNQNDSLDNSLQKGKGEPVSGDHRPVSLRG